MKSSIYGVYYISWKRKVKTITGKFQDILAGGRTGAVFPSAEMVYNKKMRLSY